MHTEIEVNEVVEPKDYFRILKTQFKKTERSKLKTQLTYVAEQIIAAKRAGQKEFLKRLAFTYKTLLKEQIALASDIGEFVYRDDIKQYIESVDPKNSVKIIELSRYHRAIPLDILKRIEEVKMLEIFDAFCVVFTDLTDESYEMTVAEKERNKDPILFGYFKHDTQDFKHDRFYFIADWVDDYCDLTFEKMMDSLGARPHEIDVDQEYLTRIVEDTYDSMKNSGMITFTNNIVTPKPTLWGALKQWWNG